jgi:hypothetical protein
MLWWLVVGVLAMAAFFVYALRTKPWEPWEDESDLLPPPSSDREPPPPPPAS